MSLIAAGGMRATKVKYVPARIVEQYIAALKISDKRELFFLPQRSHGRVNTTVSRGLARAPGSAYPPLNEKMPRTFRRRGSSNQLPESRADSGLIAKSPGNPQLDSPRAALTYPESARLPRTSGYSERRK